MDFTSEIEKRLGSSKKDDGFAKLIYIFMRDLNLSYSEILELPIPMAFELKDIWEKEQKEIEKMSKRKK